MKKIWLLAFVFLVILSGIVSAENKTSLFYEGEQYCDFKVLIINPSEVVLQIDDVIREIEENDEITIRDYDIYVKNVFYSAKSSVRNWAEIQIYPELPSHCFRELTEEEKALGFEENYTVCPNTKKSEFNLELKPDIVENYYCPSHSLPASKIITSLNIENSGLGFLKENFSEFPDLNFIECSNNKGYQPETHLLFKEISGEWKREAWICGDFWYIFDSKENKVYGNFGDGDIEEQDNQDIEDNDKENFLTKIINWFKNLFK